MEKTWVGGKDKGLPYVLLLYNYYFSKKYGEQWSKPGKECRQTHP